MNSIDKQKSLSMVFFILLGVLASWSFITQGTKWGSVYSNVFYLVVILFILSIVVPRKFEANFVNPKNLWMQFAAGGLFGLVLVSSYIVGSSLSFLSPLSIPKVSSVLGILGINAVTLVFAMSVIPSEFEENLRSATLRPTIAEWLQDSKALPSLLIMFGVLLFFLVDSFRVLGIGFIVFGFLVLQGIFLKNKGITNKWVRMGISIVFVGVLFALLHFTAYATGNPAQSEALMFNAFLYAIIADSINTYFGKTTIPSKIAHTTNNAVVSCAAVGIPIVFAVVVVVAHASILYAIARS